MRVSPAVLRGEGHDAEDGALSGDGLAWRVEGLVDVAHGAQLEVRPAAGRYLVTLRATDCSGNTGEATLTLEVRNPPTTATTSPTPAPPPPGPAPSASAGLIGGLGSP